MSKFIDSGAGLLQGFPYSLSRDDDKQKLAESIADELALTAADTVKALIFPCIDELPETVLDTLAYDFKVDWYEYSAPIRNKRNAIKECILVHKFKGTKYAVETAVHSLYDKAEVREWFEYGGEPFHFKIKVFGSSSENIKHVYQKIQYAKNLRSVLDSVAFVLIPEGDMEMFVGVINSALNKRTAAEVRSDDDSVYTASADSLSVGIKPVGKIKRIFSRLEYGRRSDLRGISADTSVGMSAGAEVKRICSTLEYAQPARPQSVKFKANVGIESDSAVKKIYVEVKQ